MLLTAQNNHQLILSVFVVWYTGMLHALKIKKTSLKAKQQVTHTHAPHTQKKISSHSSRSKHTCGS